MALSCASTLRADLAQIHLDRNVTANEMLLRCAEAARGQDPAQAVDLLAELLDRHGEELVEADSGLHVNVSVLAGRLAGQWPATALARLRQVWGPVAAEQWQSLAASTDYAQIDRFARRYFPTAAGAQAAQRAARLALEAGWPDLARLWLAELLQFHPDRAEHAAAWQGLHDAALILAGRTARHRTADTRPAQSTRADPAAADLARRLTSLKPMPEATRTPGRIDDPAGMAILWQANLTDGPDGRDDPDQERLAWLPAPVLHEKSQTVVVQQGRVIRAFDQNAGNLVWRYEPLTPPDALRAGLAGPTAPRRPAAWGTRIYLVTETPLPRHEPGPLQVVQAMHCLDARTGRPEWVRAAGEMLSRAVPIVLDGTPAVSGERVYLAARTVRAGGYHDVSLLQVDAWSGRLLGRVHLFGVARPEYVSNDRIVPVRLGACGGIVYAASPEGAVAAVDAGSLRPLWIRSLKPEQPGTARASEESDDGPFRVPALWADAPLRMADALVVPLDAGLQVLDALSGAYLRPIVLASPITALAAPPGTRGRVAAAAQNRFFAADVETGAITHQRQLARSPEAIGGLCATADGRLLLSLGDRLELVQADDTAEPLPVENLSKGIPLAGHGRIYLASAEQLTCLGDAQQAMVDLERRSAASRDPTDAVRLMELALRLHRTEVALGALAAAINRGAAEPARAQQPVIERLFESSLLFARQYGQDPDPSAQRVIERLLEVADRCALHGEQRIRQRAVLAAVRIRQNRPAEAVAAWQSVLGEQLLRNEPLPRQIAADSTAAGTWAQEQIAEAVAEHGGDVYEQFDAEAAAALAQGSRAADRQALEALILRYPNSVHVGAARLAIGEILLNAGDVKGALQPLRRAALEDPADPAVRHEAMARLSDAYEKLHNPEAAATWMARLAHAAPNHSLRIGERTWTAAAYAAQLQARLPRPTPRFARIDAPLHATWLRTFPDSVSLVGQDRPEANEPWMPVLAWSAGWLQAFRSNDLEPAWKAPPAFRTLPRLLAAGPDRLVLFDRHRVAAVDPKDGRVLWEWTAGGPDPDAPDVDPETLPEIIAATASRTVLVFTADRQAVLLEPVSGQERWRRRLDLPLAGRLSAREELAVYACSVRDQVAYRALDLRTGNSTSLWRSRRNVPGETLALLPAAIVVRLTSGGIEAYDAYTGSLFWQVDARQAFRPTARLCQDGLLWAADGERELLKIDAVTGRQIWRARLDGKLGTPVRVLAEGPRIWLIAEGGGYAVDDATGRVIDAAALPAALGPAAVVRDAAPCSAGVLCLVVQGKAASEGPPAALAVLSCDGTTASAAVAAPVDQATGLVGGWEVRDNTVLIASGNRLIGLSARQRP